MKRSKKLLFLFCILISLCFVRDLSSQTIVTLTSPNGGEVFAWDSTHTITWTFTPPPSWPYDCNLFLSTDGGATFPDTIAFSVSGDTFCLWTIPHVVSTTCRVLIQVDSCGVIIDCEDVSDSNFSIVQSGVEENEGEPSTPLKLGIFPNPFTTSTIIILPSTEQRAKGMELHIYDSAGRLVKSMKLTTNHLSLGTDFPPGIYFLKLNGKNVGKVVKVR